MTYSSDEERQKVQNLDIQTLTKQMERMTITMQQQMERMNVRLNQSETQQTPPPQAAPQQNPIRANQHPVTPPQEGPYDRLREQELGGENMADNITAQTQQTQREIRRVERVEQPNNIKVKIPPFQGKNDLEVFLERVTRMEMVFQSQYYSEHKKVRIAAIEFSGYVIVWWEQLVISRRRNSELPIESWEKMKAIMTRWFIPNSYYRKLHLKLQQLTQGN